MICKFVITLLITVCLGACATIAEQQKEVNSEVVLIFENAPTKEWFYLTSDTTKTAPRMRGTFGIAYCDSVGKVIRYEPKAKTLDTLVIETFNGFAEMEYFYSYVSKIEYLFVAGDTVVFTYDNTDYPAATSRTNPQRKYNLDQIAADWRMSNGFSAYGFMNGHFGSVLFKKEVPKFMKRNYSRLYVSRDSVIENYGEVSEAISNYLDTATSDTAYLNRLKFYHQRRNEKVNERIETLVGSAQSIDGGSSLPLFKKSPKENIDGLLSKVDDSKIGLLSYNRDVVGALSSVYSKLYGSTINYTHYGGGGGGSFVDARNSFDSVATMEIAPFTKMRVLGNLLTFMKGLNLSEQIVYHQKYISVTGDTTLNSVLEGVINEAKLSGELLLEGLDNQKTTFSKLLAKHKGNVIYVDFWGVGCPPCLRAMPDAVKLSEKYSDKGVVFLYITFNEIGWRDAIEEYGIKGEHYIITNRRAAKLIKEYELYEIPRYIIFDKNGKLVEFRAEVPSKVNFEKYL